MSTLINNSSNRWWAVALASELPKDELRAVMVDGEEFVLFRDAAGGARALLDQCAHRRAPLSLGKLTATGLVECPYHGWRYDGQTGACMVIPNLSKDERVPPAYRVPAFQVQERAGIVYVNTDSKADATDAAGLPPNAAAASATVEGAHLIAYPRALLIDLLLDSPSAVLDISNVAVVDNHWYGEPVIRDGVLVLDYAAQWADQVSAAAVADYPLLVRISLDLSREAARIEVRSDEDDLLASAWAEATPVKAALTLAVWQAVQSGPDAEQTISIGIKRQIDPEIVKTSQGNASKMRRLGMIAAAGQPVNTEETTANERN